MVEVSRFSVVNKKLISFKVTNMTNAESYSGIVEGGNELIVWAYNASVNNSLTSYQNLTDYTIFYFSNVFTSYVLDAVIYQEDLFIRRTASI